MRKIFVLIVILIPINLFGQCENFSKEIFEIIKSKDYHKFENYILSIVQQRKLLHWPDNQEGNDMLKSINDSLNTSIIKSAIELRNSYTLNGCNFDLAEYVGCKMNNGSISKIEVDFKICDSLHHFSIQTVQTDKIYIAFPINYESDLLNSFEDIQPEIKTIQLNPDSDIFTTINGKRYKNFNPNTDELDKGKKLLRKHLEPTSTEKYSILKADGLIDNEGFKFIFFITLFGEKQEVRCCWVDLVKEQCRQEE